MKKINLPILLLIILPYLSYSQSTYLVGTAQESIEPDPSLISLHMAGYGLPREGRFTLQWINRGRVPVAIALGASNEKLYIVSNGDLFSMNSSENISTWEKAGKAAAERTPGRAEPARRC